MTYIKFDSRFCIQLSAVLICVALTACMRPPSLLVREGGYPSNTDDDVAFRTTYYFRVFDPCTIQQRLDPNGKHLVRPLNDTIYRFRMTGKASTLLSNIRFESGTLKAAEIDPFGANVEFNKELNRFVFETQEDLKARAQRKIALSSFQELKDLYDELAGSPKAPDPGLSGVRTQLSAALAQLVADYMRRPAAPGGTQTLPLVDSQSLNVTRKDNRTSLSFSVLGPPQEERDFELVIEEKEGKKLEATLSQVGIVQPFANLEKPSFLDCQEGGIPTRRGFQILGPEGWRTFDQDERLLLAMSADSEPLIGTLKELSQRILRSHESGFAFRLPLAQERLRVAQANDQLDLSRDDEPPSTALDRAIRVFDISAVQPQQNQQGEQSQGPLGEQPASQPVAPSPEVLEQTLSPPLGDTNQQ